MLFSFWKTQKTHRGFKTWMLALLVTSCGYFLYMLGGSVPVLLSSTVGNLLIPLSIMMRLDSTRKYFLSKALSPIIYSALIPSAILFLYFTFSFDSVVIRGVIIGLLIVPSLLAASLIAIRFRELETWSLRYGFAAALFITALFWTAIIIRAIITPGDHSLSGPDPINPIFFTVTILMDIVATVFFLLLNMARSQTELRQSEEQYRNLADNLPDYIIVHDGEFILYANPAAARLIEPSRETLVGQSIYSFMTPASAEASRTFSKTTRNGASPSPLRELDIQLRDGTIRHCIVNTVAINDRGEPAFLSVITDITERKQAEDALRESEEKYRAFFLTSRDCIFITTLDGRWVDFNDAAVEMFGYDSRDDLLKTNLVLMYANPRDRDTQIEYVHEKGYSFEYPVDLKKKDGTIINALITSVARKDASGNTIGFLGSVRDITDLKRAEDNLRMLNNKLKLLSGITRHDMKNQLVALNAYIDLCMNAIDNPAELKEFITKELKIAEVLAEQIDFTEDYEDIGAKSSVWQNVSALVKRAGAALPLGDIRLEVTCCASLEVYADPLLEKVFYNLFDNSLHYGGENITSIRVTAHETDGNLHIIFEDNGSGISAEDKKDLFTKGFGKHTGLGLFLSREILSITGISISETGVRGKGARFEIAVPEGAFRFTDQ